MRDHLIHVYSRDSVVKPQVLGGGTSNPRPGALGPDDALYATSAGDQRLLVYTDWDGTLYQSMIVLNDAIPIPVDVAVDRDGTIRVASVFFPAPAVFRLAPDGSVGGATRSSSLQLPVSMVLGREYRQVPAPSVVGLLMAGLLAMAYLGGLGTDSCALEATS